MHPPQLARAVGLAATFGLAPKLYLQIRTFGKLGVLQQIMWGLLLIPSFLHQQVFPEAQFHAEQKTPEPQTDEGRCHSFGKIKPMVISSASHEGHILAGLQEPGRGRVS